MEKFELKPSSYIKGFIDRLVAKLNSVIGGINEIDEAVTDVQGDISEMEEEIAANKVIPEVVGTEDPLSSLQIGTTKYLLGGDSAKSIDVISYTSLGSGDYTFDKIRSKYNGKALAIQYNDRIYIGYITNVGNTMSFNSVTTVNGNNGGIGVIILSNSNSKSAEGLSLTRVVANATPTSGSVALTSLQVGNAVYTSGSGYYYHYITMTIPTGTMAGLYCWLTFIDTDATNVTKDNLGSRAAWNYTAGNTQLIPCYGDTSDNGYIYRCMATEANDVKDLRFFFTSRSPLLYSQLKDYDITITQFTYPL